MNKRSALLLATVLPGTVHGQEAVSPFVPTAVAVTALRPIDVETHTPMYIITRADLERMADLGLGEVLQRLPFMGRSASNLNSNAAGDGSVIADIGGMGSARCIVMLNGRRLPVNELLGAPAVDLDTIPVAAIERVEIFLGGASPAWGADAVTGVINIITRGETQGTDMTVAGARTSRGDGDTGRLSIFKGEVFGSGHFNIAAELRQEDPIESSARAFSARSEALGCIGAQTCVWPFGSTATPAGLFLVPAGNALGLPAGNYTFDTPGTWRPFLASGPQNDLYSTQTDTFLRDGRSGGSLVADLGYDLSEHTQLSVDVLASKDRVERQLAPLPLSTTVASASTGGPPVLQQAPQAPALIVPNAQQQVAVAANSYYNPFAVPLSDVRLRLVGLGPRLLEDLGDTEMLSASLRHAGQSWDWEASFSAARSAITERDSDVINTLNLLQALGPSGPDASGVISCGQPDAHGIVTDPSVGCVPFDAFGGPAAITPAMLGYIAAPSANDVREMETQLGLIARRDVLVSPSLPTARLALGFESLRTAEHSDADQTGIYGIFAATAPLPKGGTVYENDLLAELSWPFKRASEAGSAATLTTGARLAWAEEHAPVPTGFAALEWRAGPVLLLRSRFTQVYRPPTAGELFLGYQERVLPLGNPCGAGELASAFCTQAFGPSSARNAAAATAAASESDYFIAGNPDLRPERGYSASSGFVLNSLEHPQRLASADVTLVRLDDAIRGPSALELIAACQNGTQPSVCNRIVAVASNIYAVNGSLINGGRDESARADMKLADAWATGAGELRFEALASYLLMRRITDVSGHTINLRGTFDLTQDVSGTAYPLVTAQAHLKWTWGDWAAHWSTDFIDDYRETVDRNGFLSSAGGQVRTVGATIYHDVTLERRWSGFAVVRLSAENLFDRMPPLVNNGLEDNTDSSTYRLEGRIYSLTVELTF